MIMYVSIQHSGAPKPWNVIDIPLLHEKNLIGVIELGSLKKFSR